MNAARLPAGRWHVPGQRRVSGLPLSEQGLVTRFFLGVTRRASGGGKVLDVFSLLARLGPMFPRYLLFLSHILKGGRIGRADKERIILRVAWRIGCIYEWGHHVPMARELGITDEEILSLAQEQSPLWGDRTRAFLRAADELVDNRVLGDDTWRALAAELNENQLVEFCMLVGHYQMVAMTINSCGLELEADYLEALPAAGEFAHG